MVINTILSYRLYVDDASTTSTQYYHGKEINHNLTFLDALINNNQSLP